MGLTNFLRPASTAGLKKGDVVFHIADQTEDGWKARPIAHVGLVKSDCLNHCIGNPVIVYHMTVSRVQRDTWDGKGGNWPCVNLCGTYENLSPQKRAQIVDHALSYYNSTASLLLDNMFLYYFGDPSKHGHPAYGRTHNIYAFTCANFVNTCYVHASRPLIKLSSLPSVSDAERKDFQEFLRKACRLADASGHVQSAPFRRIHPSYLAHAFRLGTYPLDTDNWVQYQDHQFFIPTTGAEAPGTQEQVTTASPSCTSDDRATVAGGDTPIGPPGNPAIA